MGNSRVPPYSGSTWRESHFNYRAVTVFGGLFQTASFITFFVTPDSVLQTPRSKLLGFSGSFLSLAATQEIDFSFSSSRYLDVSVPWVCLPHAMYSRKDTIRLKIVGSPIWKSLDECLRTVPQSISALVPSFFGS